MLFKEMIAVFSENCRKPINPLKPKLVYIIFKTFSPYFKKNTTPHHYKRQSLTLFKEIINVDSDSCAFPVSAFR
jgi:hypothetical protein